MGAPLQRILKVGKVSVGLVGLDVALNKVVCDKSFNNEHAAEQVFVHIAQHNYVPDTARGLYREAILREVTQLREGKGAVSDQLVIRILGPGCVSCNNLQKLVIEIMSDLDIAADVFQVHDLDEIGRFGVMQTPALLINGQVKCSGRLPTRSKIEEWLREAAI